MAERWAVVTGASTGIGRAVALALDRQGWHVFAGVRRPEDGERLAAVASRQFTPVELDVTDEAQVEAVMGRVREATGVAGLGALVNNAGIALGGPLEYLPTDEWRRQFEVNVFGQVAVTRAALPMLRRGRGRVVFIGSNSGRVAAPLMGPYVASKFAVEGMADSLRMELHGSGVDVVVVEPGAVRTDIWGKGREQAEEMVQSMPPEAADRYGHLIDAIRKGIDTSERQGVAPEKVADTVMAALTARRPRARYQVGVDAKVGVAAARVLPPRALDGVLRRVMRP